MKLDERTSELRQIDKHIYFGSNLLPVLSNLTSDQQTWIYKLSIHSYSRLLFRFRITCSSNYYGEDCSRFCRERNDLFGHFKCNQDGRQICLEGWQGEQCDRPICSLNCNLNNGYCKQPNECLCKLGFRGVDCNECIPHANCLNGYCNLPNQCICKSNWGGIFCDLDLNFKCAPGFTGSNCDQSKLNAFIKFKLNL